MGTLNHLDYINTPDKVSCLTQADHKFIVKHIEDHMVAGKGHVYNMFTGESSFVTPLLKALVDCVYELSESRFSYDILEKYGFTERNKISKFDRARNIILKLDYTTYSKYID